MTLRMANPWKSPTGVYYFRERPPADVAAKVRGKRFVITVAGDTTSVVVGEHVRVSLRTKEDRLAKDRHKDVAQQVARLHAVHRDETTIDLSHREVLQLAGEYYRSLVHEFEADPIDAEGWDHSFDEMCEALELFIRDEDDEEEGERRKRFDPELGEQLLSERLGVAEFLFSRGLRLSAASRRAFLGAAGRAHLDACSRLRRHAEGNYAPDPAEARYPVDAIRPVTRSTEAGTVDLWALFNAWAAERAPVSDTVAAYRGILTEFADFVGHANAARYTPHDVVAWKGKLIGDGLPAKSINDYKLAALKAVLNHAVKNHRIPSNPAAKISVDQKRKPGTRMQGYSDEEARLILGAAMKERRPALKWVPWLCALTGARVAEMCQLRAEDVRQTGNVWALHITAAAGRLKNEASEREVPLHPALMARGFLDFVQSHGPGYLFFDPLRRREGAKAKPGKSIANDLREWVKGLGIDVGVKEHRKAPNHAWRHRFTTLARRYQMDPEKREAILGHQLPGQQGVYGDMGGLHAEIVKIPDPLA